MTDARSTSRARLTLVAVALAATVALLVGAGRALPAPPLPRSGAGWSLEGGSRWLQHLGPAGAFVAVLRVVALAIAAYLLVVVTLELVAALTGLRPLATLGRAITVPSLRRLLGAAAGLGLATTLTTASLAAGAVPAGATAPPTMTRLDAPATTTTTNTSATTTTTTTTIAPATDPPVMRRLDPDTTTSSRPESSATATDPPPTPIVPEPSPPPDERTWTIAPGDHLWGVAARTLADARHRPPADAEVARYLDRLVDRNRSVLVVPTDPDLVYPGQVFTLVPVEG